MTTAQKEFIALLTKLQQRETWLSLDTLNRMAAEKWTPDDHLAVACTVISALMEFRALDASHQETMTEITDELIDLCDKAINEGETP